MMYEINLPLVMGMSEFNNVAIVPSLEKKCGGFFVDSSKLNSPLFKVILEEYFAQIMKNRYILEYHLERKRERSGKICRPYPYVFENIIEAFLRNSNELQDLLIVPITINYDKVYEG